MVKYCVVFCSLVSLVFSSVKFDISKIKNYKILQDYYSFSSSYFLVTRSYFINESQYFLSVNLDTLETKQLTKYELNKYKKENKIIKDTLFSTLKTQALAYGNFFQNSGLTKLNTNNGYALTIDMCPSSKKGFEKEFFKKLEDDNASISISLTYIWAKKHEKEMEYLFSNTHLKIRWINHSANHFYNPNKVLKDNFMLASPENFEKEIIDLEKFLLINNRLPSVFFRFPGLISSKKLINRLVDDYSLLPIGANNWLVKTKKEVIDGDIVLIHGNKNEHLGIQIFFDNYQRNNKIIDLVDGLKEFN